MQFGLKNVNEGREFCFKTLFDFSLKFVDLQQTVLRSRRTVQFQARVHAWQKRVPLAWPLVAIVAVDHAIIFEPLITIVFPSAHVVELGWTFRANLRASIRKNG